MKAYIIRDDATQNYKRLHVGDGIIASSEMEQPRNFNASNFDYSQYLNVHGFKAITFVHSNRWRKAKVDLSGLSYLQRTRIAALKFRKLLINEYQKEGIAEKELAVMAALTLGDKSMLDNKLRNDYSISGAAHVLAMSGLHLSVIFALLSPLVVGGRNRRWAWLIVIVTIWGFVFLAGMATSLVRSALMLTAFAFASSLNRGQVSLNALSLAAIVLMICQPSCIHDVGFQMSFMAVLFLLTMLPSVVRWSNNAHTGIQRLIRRICNLAAVPIVAQLGVLPLVIYYFGRIPCYFLLANIIVIPCVTLILYGAMAFFLLFPLRHWIAAALSALVGGMNGCLQFVASLPGASIEGIHINGLQVVLLYALIFLVYVLMRKVIRILMA